MGLTSRTYNLALLLAFASATTTGGAVGLDLDLWFDLRRANDSHHLSASRAVELLYLATRDALPEEIAIIWREVQAKVLAPVLWGATVACLALSVLLAVEVMFLAAVSLGVKLLRCRPEKRYKWEALCSDPEAGSLSFPMVLVQIPMYNEKEVYKLSIGAACGLTWPADRLIIQVLDDSTDPIIKSLVELECKAWASKGVNVYYEVRENRKGYKAGALKRGMEHSYVEQCDFVAIFDADFQPDPDFLMRAIPYLVHNPKIALVQARWDFVNSNECLMTRMQKITLDYHFKVEQEAGSSSYAFFGFNGTAGIWRITAINEAGGWKDRTTVEDMDLAVRASLKGWKFLYVGDLKVKSELPSTFKAYRHQQHRWTCGAANLFRKMAIEILVTKEVSIWKKFHVIYSFFFVRKIVSHFVAFFLYCIVIPASKMVPEVSIPVWGVSYIPTILLLLNVIRNPRSIHLMPLWVFFENVMSMHRLKAAIIGLLDSGSVNEWVVTKKVGVLKANPKIEILEKPPRRFRDRINCSELGFAVFLSICATYDLVFQGNYWSIYIYIQALAFFLAGISYVGSFISNS